MKDVFVRILIGIGFALLSWLGERVIVLINGKIKNDNARRVLKEAYEIVSKAVKATYQTYVEELKDKNVFNLDAQAEALEIAKRQISQELSVATKEYVEKNLGDFELWMDTAIHAALYDLKK